MATDKTNNAAGEQAKCLPRHIAIILDGNGRWAKKRGMPRSAGHLAGAENFRKIATYCQEKGIEYLTVYAFSTENWKRPEDEVGGIMKLLDKYLHEAIRDMEKKHIRMKVFGDTSKLSPELQALVAKTDEITQHVKGFQANICLNYGGRARQSSRALRKGCCRRQGNRRAYRGKAFKIYVFGGYSGSRAYHQTRRRVQTVELPAMAVRVFGVLLYRHALAGFHA